LLGTLFVSLRIVTFKGKVKGGLCSPENEDNAAQGEHEAQLKFGVSHL
jgi:hypothetical protein